MKAVIALLLSLSAIFAQDARAIVAEAQKRLRSNSQRYEGILQVLDSGGRISDKRWV